MSEGRRLLRAVGWLSAGVLVSALLQYALFFAAARWLGAADYGAFALALGVAMLVAPLADAGTALALVCTAARRPEQWAERFGASLWWRAVATPPVLGATLLVGAACGYGPGFASLFPPLFLATVADGIGTLAASACQARERMATAALVQVARNLLRGAALAATLLLGGGAETLAWTFAAASLGGAAWAVRTAAQGVSLRPHWRRIGAALRDALPFGAIALATAAQGQIDIALLGGHAATDEVGRYHAAARFVVLLLLLPQVVAMAAAPLAYRAGRDGDTNARLCRIKLAALATLGLCASLFLATWSTEIIAVCLGERFAGSAALLAGMAPLVFVKFVAAVLGDALSAMTTPGRLAAACWTGALAKLGFGLWLLPHGGAAGMVEATLAAELVFLAVVATALAAARLPLGVGRAMRHPLGAALAGLGAALVEPRLAAPVAAATALLLAVRWPSDEERLLRQALRRG